MARVSCLSGALAAVLLWASLASARGPLDEAAAASRSRPAPDGARVGSGQGASARPRRTPPENKAAYDEPRLETLAHGPFTFWYRIEAAFGYASLLVDPDMTEGYGGGLSFTFGFHRWLGVELALAVTNNEFEDQFGTIEGSNFMIVDFTLGPVVRFTPLHWRFVATTELAIGPYMIKDAIRQAMVWTLGVSGGLTVAYRVTDWVAVGVKLRYNLFNLATMAGEELIDVKALREVGVLDRLDLPAYVAVYF